MAYKGTPLSPRTRTSSRRCRSRATPGVLVLVHAENGDVIAKLQEQALARGDTAPLPRPHPARARRGRGDEPGDQAGRGGGRPLLVVHVSCAGAGGSLSAHARGQPVYAETCPQYFVFESRPRKKPRASRGAKYVLPALARPVQQAGAVERAPVPGPPDLRLGPLLLQLRGQKELGKDDFTLIPNGAAGRRGRAMALWTLGVGRAGSPRTCSSPCSPPTRRASTARAQKAPSPPAPTRTSFSGTPTFR